MLRPQARMPGRSLVGRPPPRAQYAAPLHRQGVRGRQHPLLRIIRGFCCEPSWFLLPTRGFPQRTEVSPLLPTSCTLRTGGFSQQTAASQVAPGPGSQQTDCHSQQNPPSSQRLESFSQRLERRPLRKPVGGACAREVRNGWRVGRCEKPSSRCVSRDVRNRQLEVRNI